MKIHSFSFNNKAEGLRINPIRFHDVSLLVGMSGVGKTLILQSILDLKRIINGDALDGVEWEVRFSTENNDNCIWKGAFEKIDNALYPEYSPYKSDLEDSRSGSVETDRSILPKIIYEEVRIENQLIVDRRENNIVFKNTSIPKLSKDISVLKLLNGEENISPIYESFNRIHESDGPEKKANISSREIKALLEKDNTLEKIKNRRLSTYRKLALVYFSQKEVFSRIKNNFIEVFHQIEDIQFRNDEEDSSSPIHLQLKEKNVSKWIPYFNISSGMLKTLLQISQLYLCAEGTVILIDEFENSLGINCIDILTEELLHNESNLQLIITSHHPYIINTIGMEHWKLVTRKGGEITVRDAGEYPLGKSRHEAFKQLMQLEDYKEGIKAG